MDEFERGFRDELEKLGAARWITELAPEIARLKMNERFRIGRLLNRMGASPKHIEREAAKAAKSHMRAVFEEPVVAQIPALRRGDKPMRKLTPKARQMLRKELGYSRPHPELARALSHLPWTPQEAKALPRL